MRELLTVSFMWLHLLATIILVGGNRLYPAGYHSRREECTSWRSRGADGRSFTKVYSPGKLFHSFIASHRHIPYGD